MEPKVFLFTIKFCLQTKPHEAQMWISDFKFLFKYFFFFLTYKRYFPVEQTLN